LWFLFEASVFWLLWQLLEYLLEMKCEKTLNLFLYKEMVFTVQMNRIPENKNGQILVRLDGRVHRDLCACFLRWSFAVVFNQGIAGWGVS